MMYGQAAVAWLILLWSAVIGSDPVWPPEAEEPVPAVAAPERSGRRAAAGTSSQRPAMPQRAYVGIDKRMFAAAFRRQAEAELLPCLHEWQPHLGAIGLSATLDRSGQLSRVVTLDQSAALPACAVAAVAAMRFPTVVATMVEETVTIQWRVDW